MHTITTKKQKRFPHNQCYFNKQNLYNEYFRICSHFINEHISSFTIFYIDYYILIKSGWRLLLIQKSATYLKAYSIYILSSILKFKNGQHLERLFNLLKFEFYLPESCEISSFPKILGNKRKKTKQNVNGPHTSKFKQLLKGTGHLKEKTTCHFLWIMATCWKRKLLDSNADEL